MFGLKPLLGLEPMAPIRPQLLVSHANHSATETSIKRMFNEPMIYVVYVCLYVCMYVCVYVLYLSVKVNDTYILCLIFNIMRGD